MIWGSGSVTAANVTKAKKSGGGWLDQFLTGARQRGYLQTVYGRYDLPIWLTGYALIKFGPTNSYPTSDQQAAFIRSSTQMLGSLAFVERCAWFALPTSKTGDETGLYRDGSTHTMAGTAYRAVT